MSAKAIHESVGKELLNKHLKCSNVVRNELYIVSSLANFEVTANLPQWIQHQRLVVKPDQLIKRRGQLGIISVGKDFKGTQQWLNQNFMKEIQAGAAYGKLTRFVVEPFVAHSDDQEFYICILSHRDGDVILFHHEGGVNIGDVDSKARRLEVPVSIDTEDIQQGTSTPGGKARSSKILDPSAILSQLLVDVSSESSKASLVCFIEKLYEFYQNLHFTYLEINPLVVINEKIYILDLAAKLDQCAEYLCKQKWGEIEFPPPFGRDALPEEAFIADLDAKSGASLKLTILNPAGRIWTMVAGGGASVIYADTICDMGGAKELANYGEYSGAPSEQQTYDYAKTLLSLMTRSHHELGKVLIIGGGIANFTNVAATFKGIVRALREFQPKLIEYKISIFVRRGGPNFQEGLRVMRELGGNLGVPIHVFGPETHMTAIVAMALGKSHIPAPQVNEPTTAKFLLPGNAANSTPPKGDDGKSSAAGNEGSADSATRVPAMVNGGEGIMEVDGGGAAGGKCQQCFTKSTKAILWGMQSQAVQRMLDFDFVCSRSDPSVVAMIYPFVGDHKQKFYWGHKEILIPVYKQMDKAMSSHPDAEVLLSFASLRSAYESTLEAMTYPQIRIISIIAEGIPENLTRKINKIAAAKGIMIIGPATVGGIKPGCFKIGNTGGMMDNILSSKLYRPGSVAYVSRSGGMSNELNNIISLNTDGVYEGVAIGGDRYPGSTFTDHVFRYQDDPDVHMIVVLGEVGGTEEYKIAEAIKSGRLTKPLICWCIGTCARMFTSEVQFGHAGACANAESETAVSKNEALRAAGAFVPDNFDELGHVINDVYKKLISDGVIVAKEDAAPPTVPMDYNWARELGLIRKPASFMTSICDERGQELLYAGIPITEIFKEDMGIGGVLSLLWFQRRLPRYAAKFIEMCLMVTADHGPAVSGAHNTIVCARAGKDLVSSLASGLLTIGDRFGGALDAAAKQFHEAYTSGLIPMDFVNKMRKEGQLIMGIGHRVKSINNPDMRVEILKTYVKENFPSFPLLEYALRVEKITTSKKPNLILNVDGFIGVSMVDMLTNCGCFTPDEAREYIEIGSLNALFVLGRSIGFVGHFLDQKRLKQGLYRHPWDDISYVIPEIDAKTDDVQDTQ